MRRSFLLGSLFVGALAAEACATGAVGTGSATANQTAASTVNVLSSRNDVARTGANLEETILTTANVKAGSFGRLWSRPVDGQIYAQPLYVSNVGGKNVVYVATEHNSIYAFDADDSRADAAPLWTTNLGPSLPSSDTGCGLLAPEIGITSTPVIDVASKTIWFTSRNKENGKPVHKLHALDIATGAPRANSPVVITAKVAGTGAASAGGTITFDPLKQMQRPGLLKVGNKIYLGFASQCDIAPYHGWLLGYDATTLAQSSVLNTTPNGGHGGIWNGGVGLTADEAGDIYLTVGDVYDQSSQANFNGAGNLGNTITRVKDTGNAFSVVTKFEPFDTRTFSPQDLSLGNGGGILIPGTKLFIAGDKRGVSFVVNKDDMGGQADQDGQIVQRWQGSVKGAVGGGVYYRKGAGGAYYLWSPGDKLKAYAFDGAKFDTTPLVNMDSSTGYPGGALAISANGEADGTAILWAVRGKRTSSGLSASTGAGTLVAYNANDITKALYSSDSAAADLLGDATKFNPPTVANGHVFIGTSSNQLVVYGLKSGTTPMDPTTPADAGAPTTPADSGTPSTGNAPTFTQVYADLLATGSAGHCAKSGCHATLKGGFKCGTTQADCFAGLVAAGLVDTANPAASPIISVDDSPLAWFGNGSMPLDNPDENPAGAAEIKAWVLAGAQNN